MNNEADAIACYFRLNAIPGMGMAFFNQCASLFSCEVEQLRCISDVDLLKNKWTLPQIDVLKGKSVAVEKRIERSMKWREQQNTNHILYPSHPDYPKNFRQITQPPLLLHAVGDLTLLNFAALAIVGTRAPTYYVNQALNKLLNECTVLEKFATVSGMAIGTDGICHQLSLANKIPTIGVLGCGIDQIYPKRHMQLYDAVAQQGLLLSEFELGQQPKAYHFPRRNRLISAMSSAILVSEGKLKSGTMVTVQRAIEQNKDVLVLPCAITNPNGELGHYLLSNGAIPIRDVNDLLSNVCNFERKTVISKKMEKKSSDGLARDLLLDTVSDVAETAEQLSKRTGMSIIDVLTQLLEYELRGLVVSTPEGYIKLRG